MKKDDETNEDVKTKDMETEENTCGVVVLGSNIKM